MANLNKVLLIGRLTRDPELRYLPSGASVCEFGLATSRTWTDKNGQKQESTCFVDLSAWGRQGDLINQYMRKGRQIFIEGRLDFSQWEDRDGQKRSKLRVVVENFQFLGPRESAEGYQPAGAVGGGSEPRARSANAGDVSGGENEPSAEDAEAGGADEIPF